MITKKLRWKEISDDGLLKEPGPFGPSYVEEDLNNYGGFDNEAEALNRLDEMKKAYAFDIPLELILVNIYSA